MLGVQIVGVIAVVVVVLIHCESFEKILTLRIVRSDFLLISGGSQQTFVGGIITFLYTVTMIFIVIGLFQEQVNLNEWIDST